MNPDTGDLIWTTKLKPGFGIAAAAIRPVGRNLFVTSAGRVSALLDVVDGKIVWKGGAKTSVGSTISSPMIVDGVIYGNDIDSGTLVAASLEGGKRYWQTAEPIEKGNLRGRGPTDGNVFYRQTGCEVRSFQRFGRTDSGESIERSLQRNQ